MDEPLVTEWAAYRAACDAVDSLRWHPLFDDPHADSGRRTRLEARMLDRRRLAVVASEALLRSAEREPRIDPDWLDELRYEHEHLLRSLPRNEWDVTAHARR